MSAGLFLNKKITQTHSFKKQEVTILSMKQCLLILKTNILLERVEPWSPRHNTRPMTTVPTFEQVTKECFSKN